ncbi:hypothetical protein Zm00014a_043185 [Zea mays]|uniref:Uncharacterized protein n=1 Tax=Zea mays TaxID=4577 RepID=A0A317Y351_MAIZE|nr:hypothetical protein Zm00014a_043185 [Zea mays]
MYNLQIVYRG